MKFVDRVLEGLEKGVDRHWRYTKEMFNIKPEYLLTVAVADALADGYDNISGIDVQVRLEASTQTVAYTIVQEATSIKDWFRVKKELKLSRTGRTDVFAIANRQNNIVELKGFDPNKAQLEKELLRVQEIFSINEGTNTLAGGHVAFPSLTDRKKWLEKYGAALVTDPYLRYEVTTALHTTSEDPEDGMPAYFVNCISVYRK